LTVVLISGVLSALALLLEMHIYSIICGYICLVLVCFQFAVELGFLLKKDNYKAFKKP